MSVFLCVRWRRLLLSLFFEFARRPASRASATLISNRPSSTHCFIQTNPTTRQYISKAEDSVLGVVEDRQAEHYRVNIFGRYIYIGQGTFL